MLLEIKKVLLPIEQSNEQITITMPKSVAVEIALTSHKIDRATHYVLGVERADKFRVGPGIGYGS